MPSFANQYTATTRAVADGLDYFLCNCSRAKGVVTGRVWPFGASLLAASFASLFFPAGYGDKHFMALKVIWVRGVLCEQFVVIFTCYGIWQAFTAMVMP